MRIINKDATIEALQKAANANIAEPVGNGIYKYTDDYVGLVHAVSIVEDMPEEQTEEIGYEQCANAMLKMWIDEVVTDGEYNRIMDKLNTYWKGKQE